MTWRGGWIGEDEGEGRVGFGGGGVDDGRVTHYKIEITSYFTCKKHRGAICSFLEQIALAPSDLLQIKKKAIDLETVVCWFKFLAIFGQIEEPLLQL